MYNVIVHIVHWLQTNAPLLQARVRHQTISGWTGWLVRSGHHCDQMSQRSQVIRNAT